MCELLFKQEEKWTLNAKEKKMMNENIECLPRTEKPRTPDPKHMVCKYVHLIDRHFG